MSNVRRSRIETGLQWRTCLAVLFVAMLAIVWPKPAFSQQVSGTISGFVTDQSGAAIPGATVTATNVLTGVATTRNTENSGLYLLLNLIPGTYSVTVTATGFQKFIRENVVLTVDSTVTVDAHMQLGQVTQEVTVTGAAPLLQAEKADVSATLGAITVEEIPTIQRNVSALVILAPGVTPNSYQQGMAEDPAIGYQATANGQIWGTNNFQIDGITDTQFGLSGYQYIVPVVDGVQEMKVTTNNYDAELGQVGGLVAQYSTKSGTNEIHGSVWEFNQNNKTFAANPYTEKIPGTGPLGLGTGPSPYNQNTFGVSLGGPIKKDKAFFFGDYQGGRLAQKFATLTTVPTNAFDAGNLTAALLPQNGGGSPLCYNPSNPSSNGVCGGSYTSPLMVPTTEGGTIQAETNMVFDPSTGNPDGTGRSAFTVNGVPNMIPLGRINPVTKNLISLLQTNTSKFFINQSLNNLNFTGTVPGDYRTDQEDARVDLNVSQNNRMFFRYSILGALLTDPQQFGPAGGPSAIGWDGEVGHYRNQLAGINFTHTFSPTLMAEFRVGVARFGLVGYQSDVGSMTDNTVGILGINTSDPKSQGLAGITVSGPTGGFTMGDPTGQGLPRLDHDVQFEYATNWNKLIGRNQLRWGLDVIRNRINFLTVNESSRGDFQFNQLISSDAGISGTGLGMGTFLLGMPSYWDLAVFSQIPAERDWRIAPYFEDDLRVTPKLTLNLGFRWDYIGPSTTVFPGGGVNYDPLTGDLILAKLGAISASSDVTPNYKNFEPRFGFAYKVLSNTVVRGGFGRSYFDEQYGGGAFGTLCCSYPVQTRVDVSQINSYFPVTIPPQTSPFVLNPNVPMPAAPIPAFPSNGILPIPAGAGAYGIPFKNQNAYLDLWNLTVQHQFAPDLSMSLAYVGNVGRHLYNGYNLNAAVPGPGSDISLRRPLFNEFGIDTAVDMRTPGGRSDYNALEFVVDKRMAQGYTIHSVLTWQKAMTLSYSGGETQDPYDQKLSIAPDGNNRAFVWTMSHIWNLPYGTGQHWGSTASPMLRAVLGGWVFNGTTSVMSGLPIFVGWSDTSSLNNGGDFGQRPDQVGNPLTNIPAGRWYNPAAFANPAPCTTGGITCGFGNYGGTFPGPGFAAANWALWKTFRFKSPLAKEDTSLEFRFESFNLFNRTNKSNPDGTANDSTAGVISNVFGVTASGDLMRQFQFGLRLAF